MLLGFLLFRPETNTQKNVNRYLLELVVVLPLDIFVGHKGIAG
jgi:hypothetical protein